MKKLLALTLALALVLTLCACGQKAPETNQAPAASGEGAPAEGQPAAKNTGTLSLLNMTEEEYSANVDARKAIGRQMIEEGYASPSESGLGALPEGTPQGLPPEGAPQGQPPEGAPQGQPPEGAPQGQPPEGAPQGQPPEGANDSVIYYDTLDALLMALNAGDIHGIEIYQSVARYLCASNDKLEMLASYDMSKERNTFAELTMSGVGGNDFAFLMMEDNAALRDEFNAAIEAMKADGTLDRLVREQIDDLIDGGEIKPIELPHFDGAETVRVAVTGALPPMDYVAADGTPAGFNTAVLAEIANRTGKNIELVVVDSLGRAAALTSGAVDAVFWTRTSSSAQRVAAMTEAEREAQMAELNANMTEEEIALLDGLTKLMEPSTYAAADVPEGTITTDPYFSDILVMVALAH